MSRILIIGYGNVLRADDGAGYRAAEELQRHYRDDPEVRVFAAHQLTPEMAAEISSNDFVMFLDASSEAEPGKIWQVAVSPEATLSGFTHQLTPASLLSAAEKLYGHAPEAVCISMAGWSFNLDDKLSRRAKMLLPVFISQAKQAAESHRRASLQPA